MATEEIEKTYYPEEGVERDFLANPRNGEATLTVNFEDVGEQIEEVWEKTYDSDAEELEKGVL